MSAKTTKVSCAAPKQRRKQQQRCSCSLPKTPQSTPCGARMSAVAIAAAAEKRRRQNGGDVGHSQFESVCAKPFNLTERSVCSLRNYKK